jgi:SAM-dependent methyltransferase
VKVHGYDLLPHLNAYWLRPESALWDAIAAKHIGSMLHGKDNILELGIGNGYFSFLMLGGQFKSDYDWFLNVALEGFWNKADIFNHDSNIEIEQFILRKPSTRIKVALDHKKALLNQASRLGFIDQAIVHDCNQPINLDGFSVVYSNMLYWLKEPLSVIDNIANNLRQNGELIIAIPNECFFKSCQSYSKNEYLWKLINRGRADHIIWHMKPSDFEHEISKRGIFEIASLQRYLSPTILKIWDIGLRPLSIPLIKMANALPPESRREIKQEWCDTLLKFAGPLIEDEEEFGPKFGGYTLARLIKK